LKKITEAQYCLTWLLCSIVTMCFALIFGIVGGPNFSHYINILALIFSIIGIITLIRNYFQYKFSAKFGLILLILFNLFLGVLLIYTKYGYINRHYVNPFLIE
jgi:hypothetical protein